MIEEMWIFQTYLASKKFRSWITFESKQFKKYFGVVIMRAIDFFNAIYFWMIYSFLAYV